MLIKIDPSLPQPIYEQVVQQIKFAIASGAIRANEMIPSLREFSKSLTINPNTISKSFKMLQEEGIVYSKRGMGLAVAEDARERCEVQRTAFFEKKIAQVLIEAIQSRLAKSDIKRIVHEQLAVHVDTIE